MNKTIKDYISLAFVVFALFATTFYVRSVLHMVAVSVASEK